jgi:TolB-like protein
MSSRRLPSLALLLALTTLAASGPQEARKAVAVLRFDNNTGDAQYENLGRALAAMMTSDLSAVDQIQLVERERLEDVMKELDLQHSAYADSSTAQTLGQIVGAEYVVTGAFATEDPQMRLDTRVVRVGTSEIVKTADVTGRTDSLFTLEQHLSDELIDGLGLVLTQDDRDRLRAQQEANRIDDLETALAFSRALCLLDNGAYVQAFDKIQEVHSAAPNSQIVRVTMDGLKDRVEKDAKNRLADQANKTLGGLLGRKRPTPTTTIPPGC